jgi:hypothetical protein
LGVTRHRRREVRVSGLELTKYETAGEAGLVDLRCALESEPRADEVAVIFLGIESNTVVDMIVSLVEEVLERLVLR